MLLPDLARHLDAPAGDPVSSLSTHRREPVRRPGETRDLAAQRVALLVRAPADPELRAARPVALAGVRRLRLPGDALDLRDPPGRGPGDADADRLLQRVEHTADADRPDRQHVRSTGPGATGRPDPAAVLDHVGASARFPGGTRRRLRRACRPAGGCTLVDAVVERLDAAVGRSTSRWRGSSTRSSASGCSAATRPRLARCARTPAASGPTAPGTAPLPRLEPATPVLGTKNGDAAIVERYSEEGATLLKNDGQRCRSRARPRRRHPRHGRQRQPHGRRSDQRGLDGLHRPQRGQPAAAAEGVQRQPGRVHVRPGQRPDRLPGPVVRALATPNATGSRAQPLDRRRPAGE